MNRAKLAKPTILVVDDDPTAVQMLHLMLRKRGFNVVTALSGQEALDMIEQMRTRVFDWQPPGVDLILLDIMMPGIDGFKVCQQLKEDPLLRHIPVVMITALDSDKDKAAAVEFGADDYFTKPFRPQELVLAMRAKLQVKAREEDLVRRNRELTALIHVTKAANSSLKPEEVLERGLRAILNELNLDAGVIYLWDEGRETLILAYQQGLPASSLSGSLAHDTPLVMRIAASRRPVVYADLAEESIQGFQPSESTDLHAFAVVPLLAEERLTGLMGLYHHRPGRFTEQDQDLLLDIGCHLGIALENAFLFQETQLLLRKSTALQSSGGKASPGGL